MASDLTVLVTPPAWAYSPIVPFSFIELAAYMQMKGLDVEILDVKRDFYVTQPRGSFQEVLREIIRRLNRKKPPYVGLSCFTGDYWQCLELAERIKKSFKTTIIVGGFQPTIRPEDFLYPKSPFDVVVIGEGEETLCEIVSAGNNADNLEEIKGIAFLKGSKLVKTPIRSFIEDLSLLPRPAYHMLDMDYYLTPNRNILRYLVFSGVYILTGRGCPYNCTYCSCRAIYKAQGQRVTVRHRPISKIIDTLKWLKDSYRIDSFYISDDTFAIPGSRAAEFCREYKKSGLSMVWSASMRVDLLNESLVEKMKDAGCVQIDFGVESGSQRSLDLMKKGIKVEDVYRAFALCKKYRIRTFANIMVNTPGESIEDVKLTTQLMNRIKANVYGISVTVPLPGSELFDKYIGINNLSKEEYRIFSRPGLFQKILDPRLRLASHNLNIDMLYIMLNLRFFVLKSFIGLTFAGWYWRTFLKSVRKSAYIKGLIVSFFQQICRYMRFLIRSLERRQDISREADRGEICEAAEKVYF